MSSEESSSLQSSEIDVSLFRLWCWVYQARAHAHLQKLHMVPADMVREWHIVEDIRGTK